MTFALLTVGPILAAVALLAWEPGRPGRRGRPRMRSAGWRSALRCGSPLRPIAATAAAGLPLTP
ncbi:hypothetical protein AB0P15_35540 [Streptomyces sp. NPDC087917]|uniref:hypothetical protein n=1 Tax=unclassified Streptomyces TaxID=2593676 RepID=UPI003424E9A6